MSFFTVRWDEADGGTLVLLDQTVLPEREEYLHCRSVPEVVDAIRRLAVRGAPALGVAGAYGAALAAARSDAKDAAAFRGRMAREFAALREARPTAVNLPWAIDRMARVLAAWDGGRIDEARAALLAEARRIDAQDVAACKAMGRHGAALLPNEGVVLTHCNAGALATAGIGTALAVIYEAHDAGKKIHVYSDETRPLLQGARLTAWECMKRGVPVTVLCDNAAGWILSRGKVDCVVVGADRIAANGDVANKIGTYSVAVLAREHGVPFYVAAPTTTLDLSLASGREIPIEERAAVEVTGPGGRRSTPEGVGILNPAFDVTPARLVTAIVTEQGVHRPPYEESLRLAKSGETG